MPSKEQNRCTMKRPLVQLASALLCVAALLCPLAVAAMPDFTEVVVFGDSLSDTGNAGRFSNGPVWVEYIAKSLGRDLAPSSRGGRNYAIGGARTHGGPTSLRAQLDEFLGGLPQGKADPKALYVVYGGGNDLLAADQLANAVGLVNAAAAALGDIVEQLCRAGAVHILVPNLPDLGRTPAVRVHGPGIAATARRFSELFDTALEQRLSALESQYPVHLYRLDVFARLEQVLSNPAAAGFRNLTEPCAGAGCATALFWDHLHPTTIAHQRLAEAAMAAIEAQAR